ncbi:hypothetical protein T12_3596 [Trichinella patagoniensis]|uniref:Uncharacterized protein n=1 Tax=Trichinella patagoniensis TaxID=990121 RepID=A0A0V0Z9E2_9BILA|nr:hypothetical protein T12_3596 [Trichinella patagoniensis]
MAESSPETIKAVAATRNIIPQIVPNVATEEITKAAEKIRREDSEKKKRKLKRKSKSKKGREMENEMSVKKDMMSTEKSETKLRTEVTPFQLQNMAQYMEEQNIMGQVVAQRDFKQLTKVAEKIKKTDSKKRNSKSAKRSKSTKTKKEETEMMEEKDTSSRKHKSKMEDEIMQWTPEVRAEATESNRLIDGMCRTRLSEKEKKVKERIAEQESRKEKKKSKNKSKSNKSKKGESKMTVKQHMKKQKNQTENTVTKAPITTEITEAVRDKTDIVQPITDEKTPDEFIKEVQEIEKKDSKKIKKKSKKRSKSKKSKKTVDDTVAKEAASSQMPETDIISPKFTLANEATAINLDQLHMVPPLADENVEKPVIKDEPQGEKKDTKNIKKKTKKRSKSKKSKKSVEETVAKEAASQTPESDIISPTPTLANEVTATDLDQLHTVPPLADENVEKPVIKDEPQGEKKDTENIKKKTKKRSKSKKSKKTVEDRVAKEAESSQMPETDIISPKLTLANELTAIDIDQPNMVPPIPEETVETPVIKDERQETVAKEAASQTPESDIISPTPTLANEVTATDLDQLHIVPPFADENVEKPRRLVGSRGLVARSRPQFSSAVSFPLGGKGGFIAAVRHDDRTVFFRLTNLIQMWRQTLNQGAFRRKLTGLG